jgi:hypothetical protein
MKDILFGVFSPNTFISVDNTNLKVLNMELSGVGIE